MKTLNKYRATNAFKLTSVDVDHLFQVSAHVKSLGYDLIGIASGELFFYTVRVRTDYEVIDIEYKITGNRVVEVERQLIFLILKAA